MRLPRCVCVTVSGSPGHIRECYIKLENNVMWLEKGHRTTGFKKSDKTIKFNMTRHKKPLRFFEQKNGMMVIDDNLHT